jgi:deoxyribodipyrimidine photolyase-like uncharacterized protein
VLRHTTVLPGRRNDLDADDVRARYLHTARAQVSDTGWTHHIPLPRPTSSACPSTPTADGWPPSPCTAGYWAFFDRHHSRLEHNHHTRQAVRGLDRLTDLEELRR